MLGICNTKQEVQKLQAFAFSVVTVNDEHNKPRFKRKRRSLKKFKKGIRPELCLKLWYFSNITKSKWFWKLLERKS